jgi:transposase
LRPVLLPVQYVRAYVRRNKSDRTDAEALLEAQRCEAMLPVPIKTAEQQSLQALHRIRQQWQTTRTARINAVRGLLREQGVSLRRGTAALRAVPQLLTTTALPSFVEIGVGELLEEIRALTERVTRLDRRLQALADSDVSTRRLQTIPGIGVITATALLGSVPHIHAFRRGRQFASWLGLTPREAASGHRRWRGRISKRGDCYLRTLLIHGARSVINNARRRAQQGGTPLTALQAWAVTVADRRGANKAAVALANKLARVIWAVWRSDGDFVTWGATSRAA